MARLRQVLSLWDIVKLFTRRIDPKDIPPVLREMGEITAQNIEEKTEQLKTREAVRQITAFMEKLFPDVVSTTPHQHEGTPRLSAVMGFCVVVRADKWSYPTKVINQLKSCVTPVETRTQAPSVARVGISRDLKETTPHYRSST